MAFTEHDHYVTDGELSAPLAQKYSFLLRNQSLEDFDFVCYHAYSRVDDPYRHAQGGGQGERDPGLRPLAWFTRRLRPFARLKFDWRPSYSFLWAQTGTLSPGSVVFPSQTHPAGIYKANSVDLTRSWGGQFRLEEPVARDPDGGLSVRVSKRVREGKAVVGLAMSGVCSVVAPAMPGSVLSLRPDPVYWLAVGQYRSGEVLDPARVANPVEVRFPPGVRDMVVTVDAVGQWTVEPADPAWGGCGEDPVLFPEGLQGSMPRHGVRA
jgi:rhizosphere induced protein